MSRRRDAARARYRSRWPLVDDRQQRRVTFAGRSAIAHDEQFTGSRKQQRRRWRGSKPRAQQQTRRDWERRGKQQRRSRTDRSFWICLQPPPSLPLTRDIP
ncbi:hypothetical protein C8Q76DRAFT_726303 [Earliella scabrosa]|nr:hypothetical protein C8Q76DRAFT_726303 [Earliella scabrosa]